MSSLIGRRPWRRSSRIVRTTDGQRMKYHHRVLGMLSLLSIITYIDRVCIGVAGPRMQDSSAHQPAGLGLGGQRLLPLLQRIRNSHRRARRSHRPAARADPDRAVVVGVHVADRRGRPTTSLLLVVRFCFGMGEAGAYPNAAAVIGRWIPPLQRTRAWGIVWMTGQIGAAVSPLLVLPIQARYGWRAAFFLFGFARRGLGGRLVRVVP